MDTETISSMLFKAIAELAHREDVRSVSCPFGDAALWKALVDEQIRRATAENLPLQKAYCLCGPERGLDHLPIADWGGYVHIPYEGVCDGDLLILPSWRKFSPERMGDSGKLSYACAKACNHIIVDQDYGELPQVIRCHLGGWTLYSSMNPYRDCNPFKPVGRSNATPVI